MLQQVSGTLLQVQTTPARPRLVSVKWLGCFCCLVFLFYLFLKWLISAQSFFQGSVLFK